MAVFLSYRPDGVRTRDLVREALKKQPPAPHDLEREADAITAGATAGGTIEVNWRSLVLATILLAAFAGLAVWAEHSGLMTAQEQLWTAFQTVLGVIVGFLGGEATGVATARKP